ncbi:MAG TPA: YtrH family sporulation protein [Bacillota bacterium]|nr:YtrH family sporulation protein [Bacillota bacterium]HPZ42757.1 YtrH family sporulation protein [Bacillota bacterium]HQD75452.1 YtrH family sporulation protein [Bacillota bacterium]HUM59110.1 YtrH family sporulation protein [Bacillota bacterium]
MPFEKKFVLIFFTAMGVMLGAALIGSLAAVMVREPPLATMLRLAREIRIWAVVAALGGTFSTIEILESGLLKGEITAVIKQIFYIIGAMAGTHLGHLMILAVAGCEK